MPNKVDRLRTLDGLAAPDLWPGIREREPGAMPSGRGPTPPPRRLVAAVVALGVAVAGSLVVVWPSSDRESPAPLTGPDPERIVFSGGDGDAQLDLFSMDPSGSDVRQLTDTASSEEQPTSSPDGSRLAFALREPGDPTSYVIGVMDARGGNRGEISGTRLDAGNPVDGPAWSPDGSEIAFAAYGEGGGIYVVGVEDGAPARLTSAGPPTTHVDSEPVWSPSGDGIAFIRWFLGSSEEPPTYEILQVPSSGGEPTLIARFPAPMRRGPDDNGEVRGLSWSPDGSRLAFATEGAIFTVGADGAQRQELISCQPLGCDEGTDVFTNSTAWSPDGTRIVFTAWVNLPDARADPPLIYVATLDRDVATVTTTRVGGLFPAWQRVPRVGQSPTPDPFSLPEGTISLPVDAALEGSLLVRTSSGAEILPAGSERSRLVPGVRTPLDLSSDGSIVLGSTGVLGSPEDELAAVDLRSGEELASVRTQGDDVFGAFARLSPDASMIAYVVGSQDPANRSLLCLVEVEEPDPRCFPEVGHVFSFDWAPDGDTLVVAGPSRQPIRTLDVVTGSATDLMPQEGDTPINSAIRAAGLGSSNQLIGPMWSPSGKYVAALANLMNSEFAYVPVVFIPDGRFVAFGQASGEFPESFAWSPVADVLAYTRGEPPYRITEAYLLDPVGGVDRALVSGANTETPLVLRSMAWSPSGQWLAIAGWVNLGRGYFQPAFGILDPADPSSFRQFPTDTGDVSAFLVGWGP